MLIFVGCTPRSENQETVETTMLSENEYLNPYDDIINHRNYQRARDTLSFYLQQSEYDTSLFRAYQMLVRCFIHFHQFEKADSVMGLIDSSALEGHGEKTYIKLMYELTMQRGEFETALQYLNDTKKYHNDGYLPPEINVAIFYFSKWMVFSKLKQCDSSKTYLEKYLNSIKHTPKMIEYHWLDTEKLNYYNIQLESECPLIDSVGMSTPIVTATKYE